MEKAAGLQCFPRSSFLVWQTCVPWGEVREELFKDLLPNCREWSSCICGVIQAHFSWDIHPKMALSYCLVLCTHRDPGWIWSNPDKLLCPFVMPSRDNSLLSLLRCCPPQFKALQDEALSPLQRSIPKPVFLLPADFSAWKSHLMDLSPILLHGSSPSFASLFGICLHMPYTGYLFHLPHSKLI